MAWTTQPPTEPGFYWCRFVFEDETHTAVAKVTREPDGSMRYLLHDADHPDTFWLPRLAEHAMWRRIEQ